MAPSMSAVAYPSDSWTRRKTHVRLPRRTCPQSGIHLCHPAQLGPPLNRLPRAVPDEVALQRGHADARACLYRRLHVLDESITELDEVAFREIGLVVVESGEELRRLIRRRIVNNLLQVDTSWSNEGWIELLYMVGREEENSLRGRGRHAVKGVEQAGEGDVRAEAAEKMLAPDVSIRARKLTLPLHSAAVARTLRRYPREA